MRLGGLGCLGGLLIAMLAAGPASAATLVSKTVSVGSAVDRSCTARALDSGGGYARQTVTMPASGAIDATLEAAGGDWDLAVFAADGKRVVAGSSSRGASELVSGFAVAGSELIVQACRLSGSASRAALAVKATAIDTSNVQRAQLARVSTPTLERRNQLAGLGLDLTEYGGPGFLEVVLHGAADATTLAANGFSYTIEVPDLTAQARRERAADAQFAAATAASELPSGRTTYRRLFDYSEDMKRLAREHPDLVRPITLGNETYEGRPVEGIELATNPNARDGRPVFLQMGVHHAREWPSGEHAMEWAYELVTGYRSGDPRAQRLLSTTRTIVVPIVNPDGFNASREAGELLGHGGGAATDVDGSGDISDPEFLLAAATNPNEYRRKNCRFPVGEGGSCNQGATGVFDFGVDPNRNYGAFWGGAGSSGIVLEQDYHGPGPFSEPETQNIRELASGRQVTTLITNHPTPCANFNTPPPSCYEDHLITVPSGTGIDNARVTFRIEWPTPLSDWDMKIYRADAAGNATGDAITTSGNGATNGELGYEEASVIDPVGCYVVRVINYAAFEPWTGTATFAGPGPHQPALQESWTLYHEQPEGVIRSARQVTVGRGERLALDLRKDCKARR